MLFDTHAHLTDPAFDEDREQIIASLPDAGVSHVILPSCTVEDAKAAQKIAKHHSNIYFAAGFHPGNILEMEYDHIDRIAALVSDPKCVGIGEIGLDYYWEKDPVVRDTQRYWFEQQLHLAFELGVPVIVHDREAHQDCFDAVRKAGVQGVFHCYSSAAEMAMELVKIGFYCSFTGVITYQGARKSLQAIQALPIERILLETDSPYLAPVPYQKQRNDPRNVVSVAKVVAQVKNLPLEDVIRITSENAARLFRINL
ncbi:MAG: TatD family hydrolase [Clostridia bacterium]|nr:TatD family hydrolase [Clostridia bacterium]